MPTVSDAHHPSTPIRVLVSGIPPVLLAIVEKAILAQPDMLFVSSIDDPMEILLANSKSADIVILGERIPYPPSTICRQLLAKFPALKILVIAINGDFARAYWIGIRSEQIDYLSADTLVENIRHIHDLDPAS